MLTELEQPFRQIAHELTVIATAKHSAWTSVVLDARYDDVGGFLSKIRCEVPNSSGKLSLSSSVTIDLALMDLNPKRAVAVKPWFGFLVRVEPSGKSAIDFNYDPKCDQDKSYFAD